MRMPLLITSAVQVSAKYTKLLDPNERILAIESSIAKWASISAHQEIVICDGSNFDFSNIVKKITKLNPAIKIECLAFNNTQELVAQKGKGYGEGEIIEYALQNSIILQKSKDFAKCTGRLWVPNFSDCVKNFNGTAGFQLNGKIRVIYIDTRFYMVSKSFYQEHLAQAHLNVDDEKGYYLEHSFADSLANFKSNKIVAIPAPTVCGKSGSSGETYFSTRGSIIKNNLRSLSYKFWPRPVGQMALNRS